MFVYVSSQDKINLDYTIDNSCGRLKVALHEIFFKVNWFNISERQGNNLINREDLVGNPLTNLIIPDGYYNFCKIREKLSEFDVIAKMNDANLKVTLTFSKLSKYYFAGGLASMLGFIKPGIKPEKHLFLVTKKGQSFEGQYPIDLSRNSILYVHLDQLSTDENLYDGKPSTVLRVLTSGSSAYCTYEVKSLSNLQFKKLTTGHFESLSLSIRDKEGRQVSCDDLLVTLEIT